MGQVQSDEELEAGEQANAGQQQEERTTGVAGGGGGGGGPQAAALDQDRSQVQDEEDRDNHSSRQPRVWRFLAHLRPTLGCSASSGKATINEAANKLAATSPTVGGLDESVRRLSNVSLRNIQLLSLKPRSELDAYADGLRRRRRSSLINLILGAPSSGPRFSDDLCSLSSHMSELCQFNIEFLPDFVGPVGPGGKAGAAASLRHQQQQQQHWQQHRQQSVTSASYRSQQQHLGDYGCVGGADSVGNHGDEVLKREADCRRVGVGRPRRLSLSSLTSGASSTHVSSSKEQQAPGAFGAPGDDTGREIHKLADDEDLEQVCEATTRQTTTTATRGDKPVSSSAATPTPFKRHHFQQHARRPSLASTALASIDLTSSFEKHDKSGLHDYEQQHHHQQPPPPLAAIPQEPEGARRRQQQQHLAGSGGGGGGLGQTISSLISGGASRASRLNCPANNNTNTTTKTRINQSGRVLRRSGSELSLYSSLSSVTSGSQDNIGVGGAGGGGGGLNWPVPSAKSSHQPDYSLNGRKDVAAPTKQTRPRQAAPATPKDPARETKLIIMLQVCLPFILAGFGNMAAGLALNRIAHWRAFQQVPIFFVLLPSFVGLKGNIEMTLASRLSTLSNLKLLDSGHQRRHAYLSNLILILSQAIGLSLFAALIAILCEYLLGGGALGHVQGPSQNGSSISATSAAPPPPPPLPPPPSPPTSSSSASSHQSAVINSTLASSGHANASMASPEAAIANISHHQTASPVHHELASLLELAALVVLPSALITASLLVVLSSVVMSLAIALANLISVNPDNLSTLIAALYGDVTCVLTYGLFADWMFTNHELGARWWPVSVLVVALISYPILCYLAYKFKMTHDLALASMPPMLTGILVSIGSGAVLSLVVGRFSLIALYQPVVNGFGANLVAVQASRVSTWLWCKELRRVSTSQGASRLSSVVTVAPAAADNNSNQDQLTQKKLYNSLASFTSDQVTQHQQKQSIKSTGIPFDEGPYHTRYQQRSGWEQLESPTGGSGRGWFKRLGQSLKSLGKIMQNCLKLLLWSFCNPSPNSIAARLLLLMLIPAHTIYFFVIWLLSPANYVTLTWPFYFVYISLCLLQVFVLLSICEPLMALLMRRHLDPDVFGISLLMALADLVGTLCLTGAFLFLAGIGDVNALIK